MSLLSHGLVTIERICPICGQHTVASVDAEGFGKLSSGVLIQEAFPEYNAAERELIKSGYCFDCQRKLFGTDFGPENISLIEKNRKYLAVLNVDTIEVLHASSMCDIADINNAVLHEMGWCNDSGIEAESVRPMDDAISEALELLANLNPEDVDLSKHGHFYKKIKDNYDIACTAEVVDENYEVESEEAFSIATEVRSLMERDDDLNSYESSYIQNVIDARNH